MLSTASSHAPSVTVNAVPFPSPGSIVPKKYSPPLISGCANIEIGNNRIKIKIIRIIIFNFYGNLLI